MYRIKWAKPSPALVVSMVALFVALGSGAYAAAKIDTQDIKKKAVTTPKLDGKAVSKQKIAGKAVTAAKVAKDSIKSAKVQDESLETDDYGPETVTESKLADDAVSTDKLADSAVDNDKLAHPTYSAVVAANGNLVRANGVDSSARLGQGLYETRFGTDLSQCTWVAQIGSPDGVPVASGEISTSLRSPGDSQGLLHIVNGSNGVVQDRPFHLLVYC